MIKLPKKDPWTDASMGEPFELRPTDAFAPIDNRGAGLRRFVEQEVQRRTSMFESCSSETLAPGVYIRKQANGAWELLMRQTRGRFLAFYADTRDEILAIAERKMEERNGNSQ